MSKNPENLYQRKGVWWIRYNVNGKKVRRSLDTASVRMAKKLRDEIMGGRAAGDSIRSKFGLEHLPQEGAPVKTFRQVATAWLDYCESIEGAGKGQLSTASLTKYKSVVNTWLLPEFEHKRINELTRENAEAFVARLRKAKGRRGKKMSADQVSTIFGRLRAIYIFARKRGIFTGLDPTEIDRPPQPGTGRDVTLTLDEAQRFLAQLDGRYYYMVSVAWYTGLRWGEVNGLAWEDIDLERGEMSIRRSYMDQVKTRASAETLPLHPQLIALLRAWQTQSVTEWVFPCRTGKPKKRATAKDLEVLAAAATKAKIGKHVTTHVFRHSFGTHLYESIHDPKAVMRLMRHTNLKTTMKYVHDRRDLSEKVASLPALGAKHLRAVD